MIAKIKVNMAGPYHLKKNIPCQDAFYIRETPENVVVGAVADGLGSELNSDIGAKVQSNVAVRECCNNYKKGMNPDEVVSMMKRAFTKAYKEVVKVASKDGNDVDQYDATLCLVIYDGEKLYYGQSGDSGLVVALSDGTYCKVTEQQRDEDGNVYPLCFGPEYWDFGFVEGKVTAAMLMTDGVWDQICPPVLRYEEQPINVALAEMFMNHYGMSISETRQLERDAVAFLREYPTKLLDDDKTVVVLINSEAEPQRMPEDYYKAPDWNRVNNKINERLYEKSDVQEETNSVIEAKNNEPKNDVIIGIPIDLRKVRKTAQEMMGSFGEIMGVSPAKEEPKVDKKKDIKGIRIDIKV